MNIYPRSDHQLTPFILTEIEKDAIKKGYVTAIEEGLVVDQDKALRALELTNFTQERILEIKSVLWQIFYLENELKVEVEDDVKNLESAYAEGTTDSEALSVVISCKAIDPDIFADRFARIKQGEQVTDAVLPKKVVEEIGELGEGEIIKP